MLDVSMFIYVLCIIDASLLVVSLTCCLVDSLRRVNYIFFIFHRCYMLLLYLLSR